MRLPLDCEAEYHPDFLTRSESREAFEFITRNFDLAPKVMRLMDGTDFPMAVGKCFFVDRALRDHRFLPDHVLAPSSDYVTVWPPLVENIKGRVERLTGKVFGVGVCVYYENGEAGADFHADMPEFGSVAFIPSLSLGEARDFVLRRKEDHADQYRLTLQDGSLLIMGANCQEAYEHAVPPDASRPNPRINLSFRQFGWE